MTGYTLDDLRNDLERAYEKNVVAFYHIGKVATSNSFISDLYYEDACFDVYVALKSEYMIREDVLKRYMRRKYGELIRILAVERYG